MPSTFLSRLHKHFRSIAPNPAFEYRPESGKPKAYERMPQIALPEPRPIDASLGDALRQRATRREANGALIPTETLSDLLGASLKLRQSGTRPYPSGSALYPVETYLVARGLGAESRGVYHYDPERHALARLFELPDAPESPRLFTHLAQWAEDAPLIIVFTSLWEKSAASYRDFAYNLSLFEAGHMAQNVLLSAAALRLNACPLCGINDDAMIAALGIDERFERPIYAIALSA